MATQEQYILKIPKALSHQRPILASPARFKMAVCGRRFGKTITGLIQCLYGHGPLDGDGRPQFEGAVYGGNIAWITSTNKNAKKVIWPLLKRATKDLWQNGLATKNEVDKTITFHDTGGIVTVWSAEAPDSVRGDGLTGVVLDEIAFAKDYLWFEVLRPALMDNRGWAMFITTPNGENWLYDLFEFAKTRLNWETWQLPTWANPAISKEEIEELKDEAAEFGRSIEQEIEAKFTTPEGLYWPAEYFHKDKVSYPHWPLMRWDDDEFTVAAWDSSLGKKTSDYPACCLVGKKDDIWYADFFMQKHPVTELSEHVVEWLKSPIIDKSRPNYTRYVQPQVVGLESPGRVSSDPRNLRYCTLGSALKLEMAKSAMPQCQVHLIPQHHFGAKKELRIVGGLDQILREGRLRLIDSPGSRTCLHQLRNYGDKTVNDDGPDALAMAIGLYREFETGLDT